ncbi:MAG: hypothetical protein ACFB9N_02620 [Geitlerinemataceae cyanobacterium]
MQPSFKALILLTFATVLLLLPFVFSPVYVEVMRDRAIELYHVLRGELYKQATGFAALTFVIVEVLLTVRKRSRSWPFSIKVPGSMKIWRSVHIYSGVILLALVAVHTIGARGLNFNAVLLWVFFGVTLTALVGAVAETGLLESTRRRFGTWPGSAKPLTKGVLVRNLRSIWLTSHIFLVWMFAVMLAIHIFLVYYFA